MSELPRAPREHIDLVPTWGKNALGEETGRFNFKSTAELMVMRGCDVFVYRRRDIMAIYKALQRMSEERNNEVANPDIPRFIPVGGEQKPNPNWGPSNPKWKSVPKHSKEYVPYYRLWTYRVKGSPDKQMWQLRVRLPEDIDNPLYAEVPDESREGNFGRWRSLARKLADEGTLTVDSLSEAQSICASLRQLARRAGKERSQRKLKIKPVKLGVETKYTITLSLKGGSGKLFNNLTKK